MAKTPKPTFRFDAATGQFIAEMPELPQPPEIKLSKEGAKKIVEMVENPPAPNKKLVELMQAEQPKKKRGRPAGSKNKTNEKVELVSPQDLGKLEENTEKIAEVIAEKLTKTQEQQELETVEQILKVSAERRSTAKPKPKQNKNDLFPIHTIVEYPIGDNLTYECYYCGASDYEKGKHCLRRTNGGILIYAPKEHFYKKENQDIERANEDIEVENE